VHLILVLYLSLLIPILKAERIGEVESAAVGNEFLLRTFSNQSVPNKNPFNATTSTELKPFDRLEINIQRLNESEKDKELLLYVSRDMLSGLSALPIVDQEFGDITIFYEKGDYYAVRVCFFDVYKWVDGNWKNLYTYDNKGYNCASRFFFRQGKLHSIGGRGFWQSHSNLLIFDEQLGSWDRVNVKGEPNDVNSKYTGVTEKSIFCFFPADYSGKRYDLIYWLDFNSKTWRKFDFSSLVTYQREPQVPFYANISDESLFDSKDYMVLQVYEASASSVLFLLDKHTFSFRWLENKPVESKWKKYKWKIIHNNDIFLRNIAEELKSIDLDKVFNEAIILEKPKEIPLKAEEAKLIQSIWRWSILAFFLGIGVNQLVVYFQHKNDSHSSVNPKKEAPVHQAQHQNLEGQINRLLSQRGKILTKDELDTILHLRNQQNLDSLKVLRSKALKIINQQALKVYGQNLVLRQREEDDKRVMLYRINDQIKTNEKFLISSEVE